jgi:hypothetical protein
MVSSPRLSFSGYKFSEALYRNKDAIKGIIAILTGITAFNGFDWQTFGISVGIATLGLGVKLLADAVDFYFSEIELKV